MDHPHPQLFNHPPPNPTPPSPYQPQLNDLQNRNHSLTTINLLSDNQPIQPAIDPFPKPASLKNQLLINDPSASASASASASTSASPSDPIICNGCKLTLEENSSATDSVVVSFGNSLWHVDCFRCAKCQNLVEHDTNLLLLSDGSPVCENCSYICSVCKQPISNEAIVTGEESYHADCFRCRSCANRIEELIFAKTSQGIYCMTCHNERVTRSRRHAEAKRIKSSATPVPKKDSRAPSASVSALSRPKLPKSSAAHLKSIPSPHSLSDLPSRPLADSPGAPSAPQPQLSSSASALDSLLASASSSSKPVLPSLPTTPRTAPSQILPKSVNPTKQRSPSTGPIPISSDHPPPHPSIRPAPKIGSLRRRGGSTSSAHNLPLAAQRANPPVINTIHVSNTARPSTADGAPSPVATDQAALPAAIGRAYDSSPHLHISAEPGLTRLGVVADKANRRRSGFIGAPGQTHFDTVPPAETAVEKPARPAHRSPSPESLTELTIGAQDEGLLRSGRSERPMSFYDPEVLFLLETGASSPAPTVAMDEMGAGHLRTAVGEQNEEVEEVTARVRESISLSREQGGGGEMGLDVGLVEKLLWELEETKERMKALQEEYTAMRRASRSALEGISLARESYDEQVAAREAAEGRMRELKARMVEQASRLREMEALQSLEQESAQLRDSVSGLQIHLSQLVVEREVRVAEVEALAEERGGAGEGLAGRLERIRDEYRVQVEELAGERDRLREEIAHLGKVKDLQAKELEALNQRQDMLTELNAAAMRQLEETRAALGRGRLAAQGAKATQSPTAASMGLDSEYQAHMSPEVNIATTRKFKWGKSHAQKTSAGSVRTHGKGPGSMSGMEAFGAGPPAPGSSASVIGPSTTGGAHNGISGHGSLSSSGHGSANVGQGLMAGGNGSSSSVVGLRPHNFQPVSALRPVRCDYCGDKLWGLAEVRCSVCGSYSHSKCAANFFGCQASSSSTSVGVTTTTTSGTVGEEEMENGLFGNDLVVQARMENRLVPNVVTKCIDAVEQHGLQFEGIYRKTGGMSSVKMIQSLFEKGIQNINFSDFEKFNDISAITSTLKNYFRSLPNPLFTFELHEAFVTVAGMTPDSIRLEALERVLYQLPQAHFETLKKLMNHLNKIERQSEFNKMTSQNLGVVFGPTLLRSQNPNRQFSDMPFTAKVVELVVCNSKVLFRRTYGIGGSSSTGNGTGNVGSGGSGSGSGSGSGAGGGGVNGSSMNNGGGGGGNGISTGTSMNTSG